MEPDEDQEYYLDDEDYLAYISDSGYVYYDDNTREDYVVEEDE
jgi:hypothetical protein